MKWWASRNKTLIGMSRKNGLIVCIVCNSDYNDILDVTIKKFSTVEYINVPSTGYHVIQTTLGGIYHFEKVPRYLYILKSERGDYWYTGYPNIFEIPGERWFVSEPEKVVDGIYRYTKYERQRYT